MIPSSWLHLCHNVHLQMNETVWSCGPIKLWTSCYIHFAHIKLHWRKTTLGGLFKRRTLRKMPQIGSSNTLAKRHFFPAKRQNCSTQFPLASSLLLLILIQVLYAREKRNCSTNCGKLWPRNRRELSRWRNRGSFKLPRKSYFGDHRTESSNEASANRFKWIPSWQSSDTDTI